MGIYFEIVNVGFYYGQVAIGLPASHEDKHRSSSGGARVIKTRVNTLSEGHEDVRVENTGSGQTKAHDVVSSFSCIITQLGLKHLLQPEIHPRCFCTSKQTTVYIPQKFSFLFSGQQNEQLCWWRSGSFLSFLFRWDHFLAVTKAYWDMAAQW